MILRLAYLVLGLALVSCSSRRDRAAPPEAPRASTTAAIAATPMCLSEGHMCLVQPGTGSVLCAGRNLDGQLGDGSGESRAAFVEARDVRGATDLACGEAFTCALVAGGVRCFGRNDVGQLGATGARASATALTVPNVADAVEIAAGDDFACARLRDGHVTCWGSAALGAFGPDARDVRAPHVIAGVEGATSIAAGSHHTCALVAGGAVVCFGDNDGGQLGRPRGGPLDAGAVPGIVNARAIALGGDASCVVVEGRVTCFGGGSHVREVPTGEHDHTGHDHAQGEAHDAPTRAPTGSPRVIPALAHVKDLAISHGHACAMLEDGTMRCWGDGAFGKLGAGSSTASRLPSDVLGLVDAVAVAAGRSTTCALRRTGALACFGSNIEGQMGFAELRAHESPVDVAADVRAIRPAASVPPLPPVALTGESAPMIDAGDTHACLLRRDGHVLCWGGNSQGQLGDGTGVASTVAREVVGLTSAVEIATGPSFTCARRQDGSVACWGASDGGLGTGRRAATSRPLLVDGVTDAVGLAAGRRFACVVHADHGVSCFGSGAYGVLGNGSFDDALRPVRIADLTDVVEVRAGSAFACARTTSGRVHCWGSNGEGTLGSGTTDPHAEPAPVVGVTDAVDLDAYDTNVCVVRRSGRVSCWGEARNGAIGDDGRATGAVTRPTDVVGASDAEEVTVGTSSACARSGAAMHCWGGNLFGQAGVGDTSLRAITRAVPIMADVASVSALGPRTHLACGRHGCCALHASLGVSCAGQVAFAEGDPALVGGALPGQPRVVVPAAR